jgi:alpha-galactosidase
MVAQTSQCFLCLHGTRSSFVLELASDSPPIWRYWGPRLLNETSPPCSLDEERNVPPFSLDQNVPLTLFPTFGVGWYGAPALLAHRAGQAFAQHFSRVDTTWVRPNESVIIRMFDDVSALQLEINLNLNVANDVLTASTTLTNLGLDPLDVTYLAAIVLPLPPKAQSVRYCAGRYAQEFEICEDQLSRATWLRENRRGLTSHDAIPAAIVRLPTTFQSQGPAYGLQLAWSGNHVQRLDCLEDGRYVWQAGEWLAPGEVRLAPQKSLSTPQALATFSTDGLDGVAQNFHQAIRERMTWPSGRMMPRPVNFNTWEGVYFDLQPADLMDMATKAARLGVERFILDDGWFHRRRHDGAGLGDWWVDEEVFPDGLLPLAQHVSDLGLQFGLWVEPEMVSPDSDLFRAHPDWTLQLEGRPLLSARNQLVLDLSNPAVFAYLLERMGALLDRLPISYLKWDHNRDLTTAGQNGVPAYHTQVHSAYRLFDQVRQSWPHIEIEACAGGGGRIDAGILQHTHRVWTSDCIDATSRVGIQRGFLQFFPPEIMGSHIGTSPAHTTGRQQAMDFRASVALSGHLGIELNPRDLSDSHSHKVKAWVALYKDIRHVLHGGKVWQGQEGDGLSWVAQGGTEDCVVSFYRTRPSSWRFPASVQLTFLNQRTKYHVKSLMPVHTHKDKWPDFHQKLDHDGLIIDGAWLAKAGFTLPPMGGEAAYLVRFTQKT